MADPPVLSHFVAVEKKFAVHGGTPSLKMLGIIEPDRLHDFRYQLDERPSITLFALSISDGVIQPLPLRSSPVIDSLWNLQRSDETRDLCTDHKLAKLAADSLDGCR